METSFPRWPGSRGGPSAPYPRRDANDLASIPGAAGVGPGRSRIGTSRRPAWARRRVVLLLLGLAILPWLSPCGTPGDATPARRIRGVGDSPILAFAFAPDGATIATLRVDRRVSLRDATGGGTDSSLDHPGPARALAFAPDGRSLAVGGFGSDLFLYDPRAGGDGRLMLPFLEQQPLYNMWNFNNLYDNLYGSTARSATVIGALLCPADIIPNNPIQNGSTSNEWYGITSYGGNAGSQSHPFSAVTSDGIFFYTGPAAPTYNQVKLAAITDGTSNTLFFGERSHFDPNYDTFATPGWTFFSQTMGMWGWWASSSGGYGLSDVAESTFSPINNVVPVAYGNPTVTQGTFTANYEYPRVNAFGSLHPGGANFAMVDGSVRFLKSTIAMPVYLALGTRAGGEVASADSY